MSAIADQLSKLIKTNRKIMNQFHKDEADIELLRKRFDKRAKQVKILTALISNYDASVLTSDQKEQLKCLFARFEQQQNNIQKALDYILEESKKRLNNAIQSNKAEKKYQLLNS